MVKGTKWLVRGLSWLMAASMNAVAQEGDLGEEPLPAEVANMAVHVMSSVNAELELPGPLRYRPSVVPLMPKAETGATLKPQTDYADLRQFLRAKTFSWQPMSAGGWKLGVAIGRVKGMTMQPQEEPSSYAVVPMASYQRTRYEWRVGLVPSSQVAGTSLAVRLRIKVF